MDGPYLSVLKRQNKVTNIMICVYFLVVYKRSLDNKIEDKQVFVEFAGNKVNEFKIVNIHDATPGENPESS